jgi:hypothetical protein
VSFAAITTCVASQRVFIVVSICPVMTQSGNFWIHSRSFKFVVVCEGNAESRVDLSLRPKLCWQH